MNTVLVTGSPGLLGSKVCSFFARKGYAVHGVDNNQRAVFLAPRRDHYVRLPNPGGSFRRPNTVAADARG
jgi:nucleoside-diphosphate-sugar epimerase